MNVKTDDLEAPKQANTKKDKSNKVMVLYSVGMDGSHVDYSIVKEQISNWFMYDNIIIQDGLGITFMETDNPVVGAWTHELLSKALGIDDLQQIFNALSDPENSGFNDPRYATPMEEIMDRISGKYTNIRTETKTMKGVFQAA